MRLTMLVDGVLDTIDHGELTPSNGKDPCSLVDRPDGFLGVFEGFYDAQLNSSPLRLPPGLGPDTRIKDPPEGGGLILD